MQKVKVAIDGPVSSGKSSVGSEVADRLGFLFIDTGLMYRAVAWKIQKVFGSPKDWGKIAEQIKFDWKGTPSKPKMFADNQDVGEALFYPEISLLSSRIATESQVRKALVEKQREMAKPGGVVMVGRDIATVVLPDAEVKIFLTASTEVRAMRRFSELTEKGSDLTFDQVKNELEERDKIDTTRVDSPLRPAEDSVIVDSTHLSFEEVVLAMTKAVKSKIG